MYEDFYNLSGKPFQLTPDQRFFFNSKVHNRAMAYLRYGLEQGEGFIVITGAVGTGKTMLVRNLFNELDQTEVMAAQLVTTQVEPDDMLRMVCASFGLAHEGLNKATMLHNLEVIAAARHAEGKRVLLVVDEAQNLPAASVEELRMLSNFQKDGKSLFQSFLLGQEEFKKTLQHPGMEQVRQRIIASYHLEPLGEEETRRYVEFRLGQVGWKGDPELDEAVFAGIHEFTRGTPRRINSLCDRFLLFGCLEELHHLDTQALKAVISEMQVESGHTESEVSPETPEPVSPMKRVAQDLGQTQVPEQVPSYARSQFEANALPMSSGNDLGLAERVGQLEKDVQKLKKALQQERKLLRKAVLLQLEMEEYDELD